MNGFCEDPNAETRAVCRTKTELLIGCTEGKTENAPTAGKQLVPKIQSSKITSQCPTV